MKAIVIVILFSLASLSAAETSCQQCSSKKGYAFDYNADCESSCDSCVTECGPHSKFYDEEKNDYRNPITSAPEGKRFACMRLADDNAVVKGCILIDGRDKADYCDKKDIDGGEVEICKCHGIQCNNGAENWKGKLSFTLIGTMISFLLAKL